MASLLADLDAAWLLALRPGNRQRQNAIAIVGTDRFRVDRDGQREGPIEASGRALATVNARGCLKADLLLAGDADGALLGLDLEVDLVDARQLDDRHEVIALLEHVDRWKGAGPGGAAPEPIALALRV